MTTFTIVEVDRDLAYDVEQLGTKRKFWFRRFEDESVRWLFKAEERSTGEDWAEKIACEICELLGIPHVHYELVMETASGTPGVVCPNIAAPPHTLVLGNQLLFERDASYPASDEKKYGVRQHSVDLVIEAVRKLDLPPSEYCNRLPSGIDSALGVFIGFAMLDAFREFAKSSPKNAEIWLDRLKLLALADFEVIISKVPASRMSSLTRKFAIQLLEANQSNLLGG